MYPKLGEPLTKNGLNRGLGDLRRRSLSLAFEVKTFFKTQMKQSS